MEIHPLSLADLPAAAAMVAQNVARLRQSVPALPDHMQDPARVSEYLRDMLNNRRLLAALSNGDLVGFLGWFVVDNFRGTPRRGAYCPEWAHAAAEEAKAEIYRALYREAAAQWDAAGCQVHALTLLAGDQAAQHVWFWNGFGLAVVDAVRPLEPLPVQPHTRLTIRKAAQADIPALVTLDAEHCQHYMQPPIFMPFRPASADQELAAFLSRPKNSIWLALDGSIPAGMMRFEGYDFGAADLVRSDATISITGAYVRPDYRGQHASLAMLDAALRDYQGRGLTTCSVDFESFNPEAASFWPRYFELVCLSLMRMPET